MCCFLHIGIMPQNITCSNRGHGPCLLSEPVPNLLFKSVCTRDGRRTVAAATPIPTKIAGGGCLDINPN